MRWLLDTNVLLRQTVPDVPGHRDTADAIANLVAQGQTLVIVPQTIYEFWAVATRPARANGLGLSTRRTRQVIHDVLDRYALLTDPPDLLDRWLDLCVRYDVHGLPAHDARLVAAMQAHGVKRLLSLNQADFTRYDEITCQTPQQVLAG